MNYSFKTTIIFVVLSMVFTTVFAQNTMVFQPNGVEGKDALLHELKPNNNYGSNSDFISFDWTFSGTEARGFSLLKFDISSLPVNAVNLEAKLSLYYNPSSSSDGQAGNNACYLKRVTSSWDEDLVTWNTMPTTTDDQQILLMNSTSSSQNYPNIDVSSFVLKWFLDPDSNHGIMLELIDQTLYQSMKFCSSDCINAYLRPKLEIVYSTINSISDNFEAIQFNLFPNPTSDLLTISFMDLYPELFSLDIINSIGQIVGQQHELNSNAVINMSGYPNGVYFIKVYSGEFSSMKRIIVQEKI